VIIFKQITYKNILSTGNVPNVVYLNKYKSTLISGPNGSGKSTILCALTFVLFGKPFRDITKPQLINSINKSNLLVEIVFEVNGHEYIVKRGIKPNIFEILCDGQLINQDANSRDYQKVLEQQILKLNFKTFTQVAVIGSATFVPFMQLKNIQRREVIEDILDIKVFSVMNQLLKEKQLSIRDQLNQIETNINICKTSINMQKKVIDLMETNHQTQIDGLQNKIKNNNTEIEESQNTIQHLSEEVGDLEKNSDTVDIDKAVLLANKMKVKVATNIKSYQKNMDFFLTNSSCPTCNQIIKEEYKKEVVAEINEKINKHQTNLEGVETALGKMERRLQNAQKYANKLRDISIEISTITHKIVILSQQNVDLLQEIEKAGQENDNLIEERNKLAELKDNVLKYIADKGSLYLTKQIHDVSNILLKDNGIKTAIIREYLPVMNKLINKYLNALDFYVNFELDESFQEILKSRNRDEFTYSSFSEGEKMKINLSILFAWRQIAKMKNSVSTNLLIMDECFDASLDTNSAELLVALLGETLQNTNLFVVSHREAVSGAVFDNNLRLVKKGDFSVLSAFKE
jgi:DNA repair exonuclease SbcCD ATPase subunit